MGKSGNWLPSSFEKKLAMSKVWQTVLGVNGPAWGIPTAEMTAFDLLVAAADVTYIKMQDKSTRSAVDRANRDAAFDALTTKMRFLKNNYFNSPPLTAAELVTLLLAEHKTPEPVDPPGNQVSVKTMPRGDHLLDVYLERPRVLAPDTAAMDYGFRLFAAIEDAATAGTEGRYGKYLGSPPLSGLDFSWSIFTRRRRKRFDYNEQDRGKKAWFIARLENAKGDQGSWGPLFWTIIP